MPKGIFITATGTDVGKTYISSLIVKAMREQNFNCGYFKPALSGAEVLDGRIIPGDCDYVLKRAEINSDSANYVSYMFKPAVSPHLAAQIENNPIKLEKILTDFNRVSKEFDYVLAEGAGGIVCPFNIEENLLLTDVIKALGLDVIIVAPATLGSINSAVLTADYAKNHGLQVKGFILNKYNENDFMQKDNKTQIEKLTGIEVLTTVAENAEIIDISKIQTAFHEPHSANCK